QVDAGGGKGEAERKLQRIQRAAAGEDLPELSGRKLKRLEEQAGERDQNDDGEPCQGQAHGKTEPRQTAPPRDRCAHKSPCFRYGWPSTRSILVNLVENAAFAEVFFLRLGPTPKNVVDREKFNLGERFFVLLRDLRIAWTIGIACGNFLTFLGIPILQV